ncbi:hypothetical protein HanOQP8_Chr15g0567131 [Helianthus annuus]|nr:hypothetical protein HanHA89_Chr15g0608271 [Helianthus annuus]KAJ0648151.1 hypothetical protein HanLR1_Chr15g0569661 [Helianthus annuus]KAJ0651996.1 hypothetical protein HanOQP8_Chr15g0567131 [Helianthus annuus]
MGNASLVQVLYYILISVSSRQMPIVMIFSNTYLVCTFKHIFIFKHHLTLKQERIEYLTPRAIHEPSGRFFKLCSFTTERNPNKHIQTRNFFE